MTCPHSIHDIHSMNPHVDMSDELPEQQLIQTVVRPGDRVLEFGANIGRSSIVAAACAGPQGYVRSFESNAKDRDIAKSNARNYSNISFFPAASDTQMYQKGWLTSTVQESPDWEPVETVPMSQLNGAWDTVIADCEGCFSTIVADMPQILENTRSIVIENDDTDFERQKRLHATLREMGFKSMHCAPHPYGDEIGDEKHDSCFFEVLSRNM